MFKLQYKDNPNRSLWLVGEKISLGRNSGNDVVLEGLGVDDFHAEIAIFPEYLILHSEGGKCFVNNLPVDNEYQLASGDELKIGNERFDIIDPKVHGDLHIVRDAPSTNSGFVKSQYWKIVPEHSKLKQKDFSIKKRCVLGRAKECEFTVPYKLLSREHAVLSLAGNELMLEDMDSANGCFVNGERTQKAVLRHGDKVAFAKLGFTVVAPGEDLVKPLTKDKEKGSADEVNKTIIRPAVDMSAALSKAKQDKRRQGSVSVEVTQSDTRESVGAAVSDSPKSRRIALAFVAVAAIIGLFWISPLNTLA